MCCWQGRHLAGSASDRGGILHGLHLADLHLTGSAYGSLGVWQLRRIEPERIASLASFRGRSVTALSADVALTCKVGMSVGALAVEVVAQFFTNYAVNSAVSHHLVKGGLEHLAVRAVFLEEQRDTAL